MPIPMPPNSQTPNMGVAPNIQERPTVAKENPVIAQKAPVGQQQRVASPSSVARSPFRFLPILLGLLVLGVVAFLLISRLLNTSSSSGPSVSQSGSGTTQGKTTIVTYWGLWEPSAVMDSVIKDFEAQNPGVKISYVQQSPKEYRERLAAALQKGDGPDVFRYHNTWIPMFLSQLDVVPASAYTATDYEKTFYPVATKDLKVGQSYYGIPLMFEGLALFYNKPMLETAGRTPPTSWQDLETLSKDLTIRGKSGTIERSGVALGSADNIDNFSDILGLLMLQNGADPSNASSQLSSDAMTYYTNFVRAHKVWDSTLPNSTYAFATEKTAMAFLPSWRAFEVKSINPNLSFGVAEVPQLPGEKITWASYWVEGVSKSSKNKEVAWKFLKYMSSKEVLQKFYTSAASQRLFGEIPSRVDMANAYVSDPYVGAYISSAPSAKSWYLASRTFDNGINDRIIKYYQDAINGVLKSTSVSEAMKTVHTGVGQVLTQFGVSTK